MKRLTLFSLLYWQLGYSVSSQRKWALWGSASSRSQISYFRFAGWLACEYIRVCRCPFGSISDVACFRHESKNHSADRRAHVCHFQCGLCIHNSFQCHARFSNHSCPVPSCLFSVALVTAAKLVPPEKSGNAVTKVFSGITVGFAFGVPLTSYLAAKISMEAAFLLELR